MKRSCTWPERVSRWILTVRRSVYTVLVTFHDSQVSSLFKHFLLLTIASFSSQIIQNRLLLRIALIFVLGSVLVYPILFSIIEFKNPPPKDFTWKKVCMCRCNGGSMCFTVTQCTCYDTALSLVFFLNCN